MKRLMLISPICLALLLSCQAGAKAKKTIANKPKPKVTALICSFVPGYAEEKPEVTVIGGPVAGKGWVSSEEAKGLMHRGGRLSLYALEAGELGEVVLTSEGKLESQEKRGGSGAEGLFFGTEAKIPAEKRAAYEKALELYRDIDNVGQGPDLLAGWNVKGHRLRWVTGEIVKRDSKTYRNVISEWLRTRGVPKGVIEKVEIEQVVRADINGDGRQEVFLSFHTPASEILTIEGHERATRKAFSYLLLRYFPPGGGKVKTFVIDDFVNSIKHVDGFCQLDEMGWAEVVVRHSAYESAWTDLLHWVGNGFAETSGWSLGSG